MTLNNQHPKTVARALGLLFLLVIICGVFAQGLVSERLIDFHDAAATANNILAHKGLFTFGFTVYLIEMASQIATAALWYVLLRPVSRPIALSAAFIELAGAIIKTFARVFYITPLFVLGGSRPTRNRFYVDSTRAIAITRPHSAQSERYRRCDGDGTLRILDPAKWLSDLQVNIPAALARRDGDDCRFLLAAISVSATGSRRLRNNRALRSVGFPLR
jgi:hypothetical protein